MAQKPETSSYDDDECGCPMLYEESGKCTEGNVGIADMKPFLNLGIVRTVSRYCFTEIDVGRWLDSSNTNAVSLVMHHHVICIAVLFSVFV